MRRLIRHYLLLLVLFSFGIVSCTQSEAYLNKARSLIQEEKYEAAKQYLDKAIRKDVNNEEAFNARGVVYFNLGDYQNAVNDYEQAIRLNPDRYKPYFNRALAHNAQGNREAALQDLSEAVRLRPDTHDLYYNRGVIYFQQEKYEQAIQDFNQAIKLQPEDEVLYFSRANVYFRQKDYEAAIPDFNQAILLKSSFGRAHYGLGISKANQGKPEEACLHLKQAQKLKVPEAEAALQAFCEPKTQ